MTNDALKKALCAAAEEEFKDIPCDNDIIWEPSEQFMMQMDETVKSADRRPYRFTAKRVLLVAAVIITLSLTTVFSMAQVRDRVINFFTEYYHTHFDVAYGYENEGDITVEGVLTDIYTLANLPEDFVRTSYNVTDHAITAVWETEKEEAIILQQGDGLTKHSIDAERLVHKTVVANGVIYETYSENGYIAVLWNTDRYTFCVDYYGDMSPEELTGLISNSLALS